MTSQYHDQLEEYGIRNGETFEMNGTEYYVMEKRYDSVKVKSLDYGIETYNHRVIAAELDLK